MSAYTPRELAALRLVTDDFEPLRYQSPCGCSDCRTYEPRGCPLPAEGIPAMPCANSIMETREANVCRCVALASQAYCEGCYVATK